MVRVASGVESVGVQVPMMRSEAYSIETRLPLSMRSCHASLPGTAGPPPGLISGATTKRRVPSVSAFMVRG